VKSPQITALSRRLQFLCVTVRTSWYKVIKMERLNESQVS